MDPWAHIRRVAVDHRTAASDSAGGRTTGLQLVRVAFRRLGIREYPFAAGELFSEGVSGCIIPRSKSCFVGDWLPDEQRSFVLAHELGHFVLHSDDPVRARFEDSNRPRGFEGGYSPEEIKEHQADVFAAEFLCPSGWLRAEIAAGCRLEAIGPSLGIPGNIVSTQAVASLLALPHPISAAPRLEPRMIASDIHRDAAVEWDQGHLVVDGGPGTGKTTCLARRVERLVSSGTPISGIVVFTTSEQGVDAVRHHLRDTLAWNLRISTPRAFCADLAKRWPGPLGLAFAPRILDRVETRGLIERVMREVTGQGNGAAAASVWHALARSGSDPDDQATLARDVPAQGLAEEHPPSSGGEDPWSRFRSAYEDRLREGNAFDPVSLMPAAISLMRTIPEVQAECRARAAEVLVDDAEDLSSTEIDLLVTLSRLGCRLWIAGAGAELAVRRFAGAAPDALPRLIYTLATGRIHLRATVRSDGMRPVRACADSADRHSRSLPTIGRADARTVEGEAALIARNIQSARRAGIPLADQVVLARSHKLIADLVSHLRKQRVPLAYVGDLKSRPETKRLVQALRNDCRSMILSGQRTADALGEWLFGRNDLLAPLMSAGDDVEARVGLAAIHHVLTICSEHDRARSEDLNSLIDRIHMADALNQETAFRKSSLATAGLDAVRVMTIHASKGLEFGAVHLAGLSEGVMPARERPNTRSTTWIPRLVPHDHDLEEEALFRVATSRARNQLHLTRAESRAGQRTRPSRFLATIS